MRKEWTTKEINLLKQLAADGKDRFEIAEALGRSYSSVKNKIFGLGIQVVSHSRCKGKIFAMYKKDRYVTSGTVEELAMYLNVNRKTVVYYTSDAHLKRTSENAIRLVEI
mgnify:CR=1 FL=1